MLAGSAEGRGSWHGDTESQCRFYQPPDRSQENRTENRRISHSSADGREDGSAPTRRKGLSRSDVVYCPARQCSISELPEQEILLRLSAQGCRVLVLCKFSPHLINCVTKSILDMRSSLVVGLKAVQFEVCSGVSRESEFPVNFCSDLQ